jgi:type I restriction enzyme, S subunit
MDNLNPYPTYKETDIPWLGQVPAHWEIERAKTLFLKKQRPVRGEDDVITCFRDGTVTLRKNKRVTGFTESIKEIGYQGVRKGDLVIHIMDAAAGAMGVSDSDGKCTPVYIVATPNEGIDTQYYANLMREMARQKWIDALAKGIRERSVDFRYDTFGKQFLCVPPTDEQDAIARYLDWADERIRRLIKAREKQIRLLEEHKQAVIQQAVTGQIDVKTGQPYEVYKDSGVEWLGQVPEHWEVLLNQRILKENIRPHGDKQETQLSLSQKDGLIPTKNMKERSMQTSTYDNWKVTIPGDLVLNRFKAHLGVFFASTLRGIVSFHYGVYTPRRQLISKYFELLYHTNAYKTIYAGRSNGMTVGLQNLSNQNFYNVRSIVPPVQEQEKIVSYSERATEQINNAIKVFRHNIHVLREYQTRLIADVVTGKVDVREIAARLPEFEADEVEKMLEEAEDAD